MNATTYQETRQQLLRRAATGDDVAGDINQLDDDYAAAQRSQRLSTDINAERAQVAREEAQKKLQKEHDDAVVVFKDLQAKATDAAASVEALVEQAKAALVEWQKAQAAASVQATQVHHLRMQGARPVQMPVAFGGDRYSVHLLRDAGMQFHQQILHTGKLPRIS